MEPSTIISIIAIIIAVISMPISWFIAVHQVKVGLDERERRSKRDAQSFLANKIDEFNKVFCRAVYETVGIEPKMFNSNLEKINSHLQEIDKIMYQGKIMDDLVLAIDQFAATEYGEFLYDSDVVLALQGIKENITRGSDGERIVTGVIRNLLDNNDLEVKLRQLH